MRVRLEVILTAIVIAIVVVYTVISFVVGPSMFSDSGWGFLIWDSMRSGGPFNHLVAPDPSDIARDSSRFIAWWSPGQYLVPGLLESLGLSLGSALTLTTAVFAVAGLCGWFVAYRMFGFDHPTVLISIALIAMSRYFALPFGIYNGGEILLFGVAPWFIIVVWRFRSLPFASVPFLLAGFTLLFFAKLSGLLFGLAALSGAVMLGAFTSRTEFLRRAIVAATAIGIFGTLFYFFWYAQGPTPVPVEGSPKWSLIPSLLAIPKLLAVCTSALFSSCFALGDLFARIFRHPSMPIFDNNEGLYLVIFPAVVALIWTVIRTLEPRHKEFIVFAGALSVAIICITTFICVRGAAVALEDRTFRPSSFVVLIAVVAAVQQIRVRTFRLASLIAALIVSVYGVASFAVRAAANLESPLGARGFRHLIASADALAYLAKVDYNAASASADVVVLVTSPEIGLEVGSARVSSNHADFQSAEHLAGKIYRGRAAQIHLVMQAKFLRNGKADAMKASFKDYSPAQWRISPLGDFVVLRQ